MNAMDQTIAAMANELEPQTVARRRDIHRHAESGWTEFRTASLVAETLDKLGYEVRVGDEVLRADRVMGLPSSEVLAAAKSRALRQGAVPRWTDKMDGGKTAVVGIMKFSADGPTVAFRADMDANDVDEAKDETHRPYREGFASINPGMHHGCGHDGHTSMALAVAEILAKQKDRLRGTVKFVFQPAEEGLRGARPIAESGILDDVDILLGLHLGARNAQKLGLLACETKGWLASTKFNAIFEGVAAHAAGNTENGRDALLAAAAALLNMQAIPRHSKGMSRIHVGVLTGGSGRNVVADHAEMKAETRGETEEINRYTYDAAVRIVRAAAAMYGVTAKIEDCGYASGFKTDSAIVERIRPVAERLGLFELLPCGLTDGSEDYTTLMSRVQSRGGQATFFRLGSDFYGPAHNPRFDFDERALTLGVTVVAATLADLLARA